MRFASLFSGGKDSTYATYLAATSGCEIVYMVTINPFRDDSWMFHTINIHIAPLVAKALGICSVIRKIRGNDEAELVELKETLEKLEIEGVVSGAIASNYQRKRIDQICRELGIEHLTPLWGRDRVNLLEEMLSAGLVIIVTAVAARGLDKGWLGRILDENALSELILLNQRYGVDICGEGGEIETLVLDAPWFRKKIDIMRAVSEWDGLRGYYMVKEAHLTSKKRSTQH